VCHEFSFAFTAVKETSATCVWAISTYMKTVTTHTILVIWLSFCDVWNVMRKTGTILYFVFYILIILLFKTDYPTLICQCEIKEYNVCTKSTEYSSCQQIQIQQLNKDSTCITNVMKRNNQNALLCNRCTKCTKRHIMGRLPVLKIISHSEIQNYWVNRSPLSHILRTTCKVSKKGKKKRR
jgi:hypothetical protein